MTSTITRTVVPVLLYHSVSNDAAPKYAPWNLPPAVLAAHLDWVLDAGYTPIGLDRLVGAIRGEAEVPERPIVVTFDDGLADFLDGAVPVLVDRGVPATLFVTTAYVEGTSTWLAPLGEGNRPMLTWRQLREVAAAGIAIGSHAHTHRPLDELGRSELSTELSESRAILEDRLDLRVDTLAYPHGYHSAAVKQAVRAAGYTAACAVRNALSSSDDDVMAVARVMITHPCSVEELNDLLRPGRLSVAPFPEHFETRAWRRVRRLRARVRRSFRS
jgi:peptidoglycan/xylan/chitin deacetylase (PgdA/CDA1 family)